MFRDGPLPRSGGTGNCGEASIVAKHGSTGASPVVALPITVMTRLPMSNNSSGRKDGKNQAQSTRRFANAQRRAQRDCSSGRGGAARKAFAGNRLGRDFSATGIVGSVKHLSNRSTKAAVSTTQVARPQGVAQDDRPERTWPFWRRTFGGNWWGRRAVGDGGLLELVRPSSDLRNGCFTAHPVWSATRP